jgi:prevent-host-death family protein
MFIMQNVGVFEAKNQLSALLDKVARGEEVMITRHGKPIAKLVSPDFQPDRSRAMAAVDRLRELSKGLTLGDDVTIKQLIEEGRR